MASGYLVCGDPRGVDKYIQRQRSASRVPREQQFEYYLRLGGLQTVSQKHGERGLDTLCLALVCAKNDEVRLARAYATCVAWSMYHTIENKQCKQLMKSATAFFLSHRNLPRLINVFAAFDTLSGIARMKGDAYTADRLDAACRKLAVAPAGADATVRLACAHHVAADAIRSGRYAEGYEFLTGLKLMKDPDRSRVSLMQLMATVCRVQGRLQENIDWNKHILTLATDAEQFDWGMGLLDAYILSNKFAEGEQVLTRIRRLVMQRPDGEVRREMMAKLLLREVGLQDYDDRPRSAEMRKLSSSKEGNDPNLRYYEMAKSADLRLIRGQYEAATRQYAEVAAELNCAEQRTTLSLFRQMISLGLGYCNWNAGNLQAAGEDFKATRKWMPDFFFYPEARAADRYLIKLFLALQQQRYEQIDKVIADWQHQVIAVPSQRKFTAHFLSLAMEMAKRQQRPLIALRMEALARHLGCYHISTTP